MPSRRNQIEMTPEEIDAYLADDRRSALRARYGDVFTTAHVVEVDVISGPT